MKIFYWDLNENKTVNQPATDVEYISIATIDEKLFITIETAPSGWKAATDEDLALLRQSEFVKMLLQAGKKAELEEMGIFLDGHFRGELVNKKIAEIKNTRDNKSAAPISYNVEKFSADINAWNDINGAIDTWEYIQGNETEIQWKVKGEDRYVPLTLDDLKNLRNNIALRRHQLHQDYLKVLEEFNQLSDHDKQFFNPEASDKWRH